MSSNMSLPASILRMQLNLIMPALNSSAANSNAAKLIIMNCNGSDNLTAALLDGSDDELSNVIGTILLVLVLSCIIAGTIIGNLFVIIGLCTERHLQRHYLILSLAAADLAVGIFVLPLSAAYEISDHLWIFGRVLCEIWIFSDVTACSASIFSMVGIALDRYWSVTDIHYSHQRRINRVFLLIGCCWIASLLISILPLVGLKDGSYYERMEDQKCLVSQDPYFQVFSTTAVFFAPLLLIVSLYIFIYREAKTRIRRRAFSIPRADSSDLIKEKTHCVPYQLKLSRPFAFDCRCSQPPVYETRKVAVAHGGASSSTYKPVQALATRQRPADTDANLQLPVSQTNLSFNTVAPQCKVSSQQQNRRKQSMELKRERKVFQILLIITATFVVCWLPFFVTAVLRPFVDVQLNPIVEQIFIWLGWSNSLINPVIYTVFSPDFRRSFRRTLKRIFPCFKLSKLKSLMSVDTQPCEKEKRQPKLLRLRRPERNRLLPPV